MPRPLRRRCHCGLYQTPILNPESRAGPSLPLFLSLLYVPEVAMLLQEDLLPPGIIPSFLVCLNENEYDPLRVKQGASSISD